MYEFDYTGSEERRQTSAESLLQAILNDEEVSITVPVPEERRAELFLYYLNMLDPDVAEDYSLALMYKVLDGYVSSAEYSSPTIEDHEDALRIVGHLRDYQLPGIIEDCAVVADILDENPPALWHEIHPRPGDDDTSDLWPYDVFVLRNLARDEIRAGAKEQGSDTAGVIRLDTVEKIRYRLARELIHLNMYLADKGVEGAKQRHLEAHINLIQSANYLLSIQGYRLDITDLYNTLNESDMALEKYGLDHPQLPELEQTMFEGMARRFTDPDRAIRVTALTALDTLRQMYPDERAYKKLSKRVRATYTVLSLFGPSRIAAFEEESLVRRITGDLRMPTVFHSDIDLLTELLIKSKPEIDR